MIERIRIYFAMMAAPPYIREMIVRAQVLEMKITQVQVLTGLEYDDIGRIVDKQGIDTVLDLARRGGLVIDD